MDSLNLRNKVEKILKEKITTFSKVKTYSNQIFRLETSSKILYCKVFTLKEEHHLCKKNQLFFNFLQHKRIPCPEVIHTYYPGKKQEIGPNPFIILSELPGDNLKTLLHINQNSLYNHPEKLNQIYYSFGEYTGRIHSNNFSEFGELNVKDDNQSEFVVGPVQISNPVVREGPYKDWSLYFKQILSSRISKVNHPIVNEIIPQLEQFIESELAQDYCKKIIPRLCHGDLNKKNIFISGERVSGSIDPDDSFIGNAEEDLMRIELDHFNDHPNLRKIFYEGYSNYNQLAKDFEKRRPLIYISRQLVAAQCILKFTHLYSSNIEEDLEIIKNNILQTLH